MRWRVDALGTLGTKLDFENEEFIFRLLHKRLVLSKTFWLFHSLQRADTLGSILILHKPVCRLERRCDWTCI